MNPLMSTDFGPDDLDDSPYKMLSIIILLGVIIVGLILSIGVINSQKTSYAQNQFRQGVRRGMKLYATQYDLDSNEGLKRLSEGYLNDLDMNTDYGFNSLLGGEQGIETNALLVDKNRAKAYLDHAISANQYDNLDSTLVSDPDSYKYYVVNISCKYKKDPNDPTRFETSFVAELLPNAENNGKIVSGPQATTGELCTWIENRFADKGVKLDLVIKDDAVSSNGTIKSLKDSLNNQLRLSQYYSRTNPNGFGDAEQKDSVSTLNMYMFIGVDIPIKGVFNTESHFNFYEVQSYTTVRTGEGGVN